MRIKLYLVIVKRSELLPNVRLSHLKSGENFKRGENLKSGGNFLPFSFCCNFSRNCRFLDLKMGGKTG